MESMIPAPDFTTVTELSGDEVSQEQIQRMCNRYYWAGSYAAGKDVVEVACGTGQGLGYLQGITKSLEAGDYSEPILKVAKDHYQDRVSLSQFDAQSLPFANQSKDVVILFEAIYYLPSAPAFLKECRRVLRPGGKLLIATANKDLFDFNPSPFTHKYYGVVELKELFQNEGFSLECFGDTPADEVSFRQKVLRPVKKIAVDLHLVPKSMKYKKMLKRLVFGGLTLMPHEIASDLVPYQPPVPLPLDRPDDQFKVIYAVGTLGSQKKETPAC